MPSREEIEARSLIDEARQQDMLVCIERGGVSFRGAQPDFNELIKQRRALLSEIESLRREKDEALRGCEAQNEAIRRDLEVALQTTRGELDAAREALNTAWQPMDTAPKDGDPVLLRFECEDADPVVDHCYWDDEKWVINCECRTTMHRHPSGYTGWLPSSTIRSLSNGG
jgi:hypothetical protein